MIFFIVSRQMQTQREICQDCRISNFIILLKSSMSNPRKFCCSHVACTRSCNVYHPECIRVLLLSGSVRSAVTNLCSPVYSCRPPVCCMCPGSKRQRSDDRCLGHLDKDKVGTCFPSPVMGCHSTQVHTWNQQLGDIKALLREKNQKYIVMFTDQV